MHTPQGYSSHMEVENLGPSKEQTDINQVRTGWVLPTTSPGLCGGDAGTPVVVCSYIILLMMPMALVICREKLWASCRYCTSNSCFTSSSLHSSGSDPLGLSLQPVSPGPKFPANSSSQLLPLPGDPCSCQAYVWLWQGLSDSHSIWAATDQLFHS